MSSNKKILIVDDEILLLRTMTLLLKSSGYDVRGEGNAQEALKAVQSQNFDLIILDLTLPDINGLELITKLLAIDPMSRILIISANIATESAQRAQELGAIGFINKPVEPEELFRQLDFYLSEDAQ
jgi:two-component system, NtrC family, response regulator AtoC